MNSVGRSFNNNKSFFNDYKTNFDKWTKNCRNLNQNRISYHLKVTRDRVNRHKSFANFIELKAWQLHKLKFQVPLLTIYGSMMKRWTK